MKPKLWKQNGLWYCGRKESEDNVNYGCSVSPAEAFRHWFEFTRFTAVCQIPTGTTYNILGGSRLMQKCEGLIRHDRYLLKVDSRQPGGKDKA